jgi:hypothetical protein
MAISRILSGRRGDQDDHLSSSPSFSGELESRSLGFQKN